MEFEEAKEILENEIANICDEELSEALEVVLSNSIPKKKVKDKKDKINEEYMSILNEYGNTDVDVIINIPNKNVQKHCDNLIERILVLQELLEEDK